MAKYILALDQGTTSSRAILFDQKGRAAYTSQKEFTQIYPKPGWVEHDPVEIYATQIGVMNEVLAAAGAGAGDITAIGIANQRETTVLWEKATGKPVYNAIVWQCRRTAAMCEEMLAAGNGPLIQAKTGLLLDAYFSATKISWLLENVPGVKEKAEKGEILFGTVDTWLLWKLTGGAAHATDYTNASRTMLFNIHTQMWDEELCRLFGVPMEILPEVRSSSEFYGNASISGQPVPITGIAGDQQAALFGQACFEKGDSKNTYGTGCFLLMHTGGTAAQSKNGLITTMAATLKGEAPQYALEGSVFVAGAVVQWLRDEMGMVQTAAETEEIAKNALTTGGVFVVPAFTGLGAPHWDMRARGSIVGLTRGSGKGQIVRAALESIGLQAQDVLKAMQQDTGMPVTALRVDGGASANNFLMQFQADISNVPVLRCQIAETTALGAAYLAGLAAGAWKNKEELVQNWAASATFTPQMEEGKRCSKLVGWQKAVQRALAWAQE